MPNERRLPNSNTSDYALPMPFHYPFHDLFNCLFHYPAITLLSSLRYPFHDLFITLPLLAITLPLPCHYLAIIVSIVITPSMTDKVRKQVVDIRTCYTKYDPFSQINVWP